MLKIKCFMVGELLESEFNIWSETHLNVRIAQVQIIGPEARQQLMVLYADDKTAAATDPMASAEREKLAKMTAGTERTK